MAWFQKQLELPPFRRGFHLITDRVLAALTEISRIDVGLLHVFIQHTSASLTINENADPDVPVDLEASFNAIRAGRLLLGAWQGIYLCEHRNRAGGRKLVLTLQGETRV
jgi:thiamine phosphate synthase YjbQ (UPF0047 family)